MANEKTEILKVGFILFAITAISALVLAVVNNFTAPVISENNRLAQDAAMRLVLQDAPGFVAVEYTPDAGSCVTEVFDANGIGTVVKVSPAGYGGKIDMVVGVDNNLKVTGVEIISQSETAGLGSNCTNDSFKAQFIGKTENISVVKNGAKENEIDAISSATVTSKAVTKGVNDALAAVKSMKGGK